MISAVGVSVVDHITILDGFKNSEGTYGTEKYFTEGGGMAATALFAASWLGSKTRLFSRVGNDLGGNFIIEGLKAFGVDISGVKILNGKKSAVSFIFVDMRTGEKQFFSEKTKSAWTDNIIPEKDLFDDCNVLLVDGHWINCAIEGCNSARKRNVPIVADFKRMYTGVETLFPFIDFFIVPQFFASQLTGEMNNELILKKLTELHPGIPVITCGDEGGYYLDRSKVEKYRAFPIEVIDSTGAGDAFHGAFCHFLEKGLSLEVCLEASSAVGSLNCRSYGGRNALPSSTELLDFLKINHSEVLNDIEKVL